MGPSPTTKTRLPSTGPTSAIASKQQPSGSTKVPSSSETDSGSGRTAPRSRWARETVNSSENPPGSRFVDWNVGQKVYAPARQTSQA